MHLSIGQEAVAVGIARALEPQDLLACSHSFAPPRDRQGARPQRHHGRAVRRRQAAVAAGAARCTWRTCPSGSWAVMASWARQSAWPWVRRSGHVFAPATRSRSASSGTAGRTRAAPGRTSTSRRSGPAAHRRVREQHVRRRDPDRVVDRRRLHRGSRQGIRAAVLRRRWPGCGGDVPRDPGGSRAQRPVTDPRSSRPARTGTRAHSTGQVINHRTIEEVREWGDP